MPITIDEVRTHCRIDLTYDDDLVAKMLTAAIRHVEQITGWLTTSQSLQKDYKKISEVLRLPHWPVTAVTAIQLVGTSTVSVADDFDVDLTARPARIERASSIVLGRGETIRISYTAGLTDIPDDMKQAILMLISHWYENREAVIVGTISAEVSLGVNQLLSPYMARRLA